MPPSPPAPLRNCKAMPGSPPTSPGCIFDHAHNFRAFDCGKSSCQDSCCTSCAAERECTAWTHSAGFGRLACMLYNGSGTSGQLRRGPTKCVSAGKLPPPPPPSKPASSPPVAGAPCTDCPNILLMVNDFFSSSYAPQLHISRTSAAHFHCSCCDLQFTDDQDLVLGGWDGIGWDGPMVQTKKFIAQRGVNARECNFQHICFCFFRTDACIGASIRAYPHSNLCTFPFRDAEWQILSQYQK